MIGNEVKIKGKPTNAEVPCIERLYGGREIVVDARILNINT